MAVEVGAAGGDHPVLLECDGCGKEYETDETMPNECPHCGSHTFGIVDSDPDAPWRDA